MRPTHQLLNIDVSNILPDASTEIYFPAIAGELPKPGKDMKAFAEAYVAEMRGEWGNDHLLWVHVSLWSELVTQLTIAACKEETK
jgi:hypothetical protein